MKYCIQVKVVAILFLALHLIKFSTRFLDILKVRTCISQTHDMLTWVRCFSTLRSFIHWILLTILWNTLFRSFIWLVPAQIDSYVCAQTLLAVTSHCYGDKLSKFKWIDGVRALESFMYLYNGRIAQASYSIQSKSNQSINYTMFPGIVDNSQCGKSINFDSKFSSPSIWIRSDGVVGKPHIMLKIWIFQPKVNMWMHSFYCVLWMCGVCFQCRCRMLRVRMEWYIQIGVCILSKPIHTFIL